jgi:predicted dehydrogenase
MSDITRIGVIGCGGFGLFALQHFLQIPGTRLVAMAGTHRPAAHAAAARYGVEDISDVDALCARDDVDLIYISTPPFLHYDQAMTALRNGKHVICEKPLATDMAQAREMADLARQKKLMLIANLMQRYNPLFDRVRRLIDRKVLGEVLHGYFENYACDEGLNEDHWFWKRELSGGIFIEHGVHFFDVFAGWLEDAYGLGKVVSAQRGLRPGSGVEEQVQCAVRYGAGVLVNFYHGFHQAGRRDTQEWRIVFERGDITLCEWIPSVAKIRAIVDEEQSRQLCEIFPDSQLEVTANYGGVDRAARARFKSLDIYQHIEMTHGLGVSKMHRYGECLRRLFQDQVNWIANPEGGRRLTEENGLNSLAMAVHATELADESA